MFMIKHHWLQELRVTQFCLFFKKFSPKTENKCGRISQGSAGSYPHLSNPSTNRSRNPIVTQTLTIAEKLLGLRNQL